MLLFILIRLLFVFILYNIYIFFFVINVNLCIIKLYLILCFYENKNYFVQKYTYKVFVLIFFNFNSQYPS